MGFMREKAQYFIIVHSRHRTTRICLFLVAGYAFAQILQHLMTKQSTTIDIEEKKKRAEILTRSLGPEYLNHRAGPGGGKLTYIEGKTAIELANDIFGYDGWSSEVRSMTIDLDECVNGLYTIGVSAVIRITLKEGNYHEDCGFGSAENMRSKIAALEKARKEACTDAFKRSLRMFGNAVGNCLYDKRFIQNVGHMKAPTFPFEPSKLLRVRHITPREIYSGAVNNGVSSTAAASSCPPSPSHPPSKIQAAPAAARETAGPAARPSAVPLPHPKANKTCEVLQEVNKPVKSEFKSKVVVRRSSPPPMKQNADEDDDLPVVSNHPPNERPQLMTQASLLTREDSFISDADDAFFEAIALQEEKYQQEKCKSPQGKRKMPDGSEFSRKAKRAYY